MTLSILSSKSTAGRCTRTLPLVEGNRSNCPRKIRDRYLRILKRTGSPPNPAEPMFQREDGKLVTRDRITKIIQNLLVSICNIPKQLAGNHSLRRGGASCYRALKAEDSTPLCSDEDVKRFGRWTSDAYKLYIHVHRDLFENMTSVATTVIPRFELN